MTTAITLEPHMYWAACSCGYSMRIPSPNDSTDKVKMPRFYCGCGKQIVYTGTHRWLPQSVESADSTASDGREGMPLRAIVESDQLSIAIGVRTLAFAFENSEENNPYDEDLCDTKRQLSISDPLEFAKDVCHELNREGEDGSTPFTRFLDSMMGEAVNQGSLGILDPDETADSSVLEHSEIR